MQAMLMHEPPMRPASTTATFLPAFAWSMKVFDLLDDKTRPKAPPIPGATLAHRMTGKKLAMIHEMHVVALDETRAMMDMIWPD